MRLTTFDHNTVLRRARAPDPFLAEEWHRVRCLGVDVRCERRRVSSVTRAWCAMPPALAIVPIR